MTEETRPIPHGNPAVFQVQHGVQFTELALLNGRLEAIEHRVEADGGIRSFLDPARCAGCGPAMSRP